MKDILKRLQDRFRAIISQEKMAKEIEKLPEDSSLKDAYIAGYINGFWEGADQGIASIQDMQSNGR